MKWINLKTHVTISGFRLWYIVMQVDIINVIKISAKIPRPTIFLGIIKSKEIHTYKRACRARPE